jgi:hypothetical protein
MGYNPVYFLEKYNTLPAPKGWVITVCETVTRIKFDKDT